MNVYKELRKKNKLTQVQLAEKLNLNQTTVGKWENEKSIPDYPILIKLSQLYKVSVDYLLGNSLPVTTTNLEITPEKAKEIWFSQLEPEDRETINYYFMLSIPDRLKVQGYILGRLNQSGI